MKDLDQGGSGTDAKEEAHLEIVFVRTYLI